MANVVRLGKGATRKIKSAIDDLYDKVKVRFLGPNAAGKRIFITFDRNLSLPGIFEAGSTEESVNPDLEVLTSLIRVAQDYLDASRERMKAKVIHSINGALAEAKHSGGMSRDDFRGLVNTKLTEVWSEAANSVHTIVDTEINHTKNVSILDGIVGANLRAGIDDPTVYFVVVRDEDLCDECKRLHLMPDGKTPRLWKLSEVSHGYHKKGEDSPSIGGLHPHCRCSLVTLMPGFGFTKDGFVSYKKMGYDGLEAQRRLERSMQEFSALRKAERARFDPNQHPRDPNTGEFVDHEAAFMASMESGTKRFKREWEELSPQERRAAIEHARRALRILFQKYPESYANYIARPHLASEIPLADGDVVDTLGGNYGPDDDLGKAVKYPQPIFDAPRSDQAKQLLAQIQRESPGAFDERIVESPLVQTYNNLLFGYKNHSNGYKGQWLRYQAHRHNYLEDYEDPAEAEELDREFDNENVLLRERRGGIRGTQSGKKRSKLVKEVSIPAIQLKHDLGHHIHLYDQMLEHQAALHSHILSNPNLLYVGGHSGTNDVPRVVVFRSFLVNHPSKHRLLFSVSDTPANARPDPEIAAGPGTQIPYAVPVSSILSAYNLDPYSYAHNYHTSENELLVLPHKEIRLPLQHGLEHGKILVPPIDLGEGKPGSGKVALSRIPKKARKPTDMAFGDEMYRPFVPPGSPEHLKPYFKADES